MSKLAINGNQERINKYRKLYSLLSLISFVINTEPFKNELSHLEKHMINKLYMRDDLFDRTFPRQSLSELVNESTVNLILEDYKDIHSHLVSIYTNPKYRN